MLRDPEFSATMLLTQYSFDLQGAVLDTLIVNWLSAHPQKWVIAAILEAIYQGRYKVGSVNRILNHWQTKGQPVAHFDHDFADIAYKQLMKRVVNSEEFQTMDTGSDSKYAKSAADRPAIATKTSPQAASWAVPISVESLQPSDNIPNPGIGQWARLTQRLVS